LRGDRRAAALDVDADRMLIGASLRASRGLRSTSPKFSAATLALPAAFRIWVVTHPTPSALEPSPDTQHEQEPLYSSPRSAVKRVLSTNCCRQSSD
jgi:hypothetical protein